MFRSHSRGAAAVREFSTFIAARLGTGALDEAIMVLGVDRLGPRLVSPEHLALWGLGVKVFSNALVIALNYLFSKWFIFKKDKG